MPIRVIFNPSAQGQKASGRQQQLRRLAADCPDCHLSPTSGPGDARRLAAAAARDGFDTVVAAGGDGTVQEVVTGLGEEPGALDAVRLGLMPLGTINVFARELNIPRDLDAAWNVIQQGHVATVDLPCADSRHEGRLQRRYFGQLGGAGLDSRAIGLVDWTQKKALGPAAYVLAGFKALVRRQVDIEVISEHGVHTGQLVLVGNGRRYGGDFVLFPKADMQDGLLDVLVYPRIHWEALFEIGYGYLTRQLHTAAGAHYFQTDAFTLTSAETMAFELDGDNVGELPATFSVRPKALRVLIPGPFFL